jgi:plastocyanin
MITKIIALALAGSIAGFAGPAPAHDMSDMDMSNMSAPRAATQVAAAETNAVTIDDFAFSPQTITVPAGTTVTWTNKDDEPHTVTSAADPKLFKSAALDTDDKFSFTFTKPGTYQYFCAIHPHMTGIVVVK